MTTNLWQLSKNSDEIIDTVITNVIKMLTERKLLNKSNLDKNIKETIQKKNIDLLFQIPIDNYTSEADKIFIVKIFPQKVSSVSKASLTYEFLTQHKNFQKILIVKDINKKAIQLIINNFPKSEVFLEEELMINIIENEFVPQHILLSQEEQEEVMKIYGTKKKLPKIFSTDPVIRYYNMPVGSVCKIIRPSKTAGYVPYYRYIIKGSYVNQ